MFNFSKQDLFNIKLQCKCLLNEFKQHFIDMLFLINCFWILLINLVVACWLFL